MAVALTFFETPAKFRAWLQKHHKTADELWVGFYKKSDGQTEHHVAGGGRRSALLRLD